MSWGARARIATLLMGVLSSTPCLADLHYSIFDTDDGMSVGLVEGRFELSDDVDAFKSFVARNDPQAIVFNSRGGNVIKAMEFGRTIRQLGLMVLQFRAVECSSACALAFMGGVDRLADAGTIGMHRASFADDDTPDTSTAVATVQALTADIMVYINEMGVDPRVLQLALAYDATDMRYLSLSEMQEFNLVTGFDDTEQVGSSSGPSPRKTTSGATSPSDFSVPVAISGVVHHPSGRSTIMAQPDTKAQTVATLDNYSQVKILDTLSEGTWYYVRSGNTTGYMHYSWVHIDQFDHELSEQRHIQIKSFQQIENALDFGRTTDLPVSMYLASTGWFAITLRGVFSRDYAVSLNKDLKAEGTIPSDSFVTYGNHYVRKLCCD